ncbi:MAG: hypothetical protein NWE91_00565 [Candidatus Bathyarchaeota archaeon]|nr:hypothetical protein [Candidatus Bathyarchaeota archaeon]
MGEMDKKAVSGIVLTFLLIGVLTSAFNIQPVKSKSRAWTIDGWAVLLEMNEFPEGYTDMPVGFINSERMQTALFSLGWQSDHVHVIHDNLTISVVQEAVGWLVNNTGYGEIALLYIFTHGTWMRNVLLWNDWFPVEWEKLNTSKKVLMVDTCTAEAFIEPIRNDSSPHISLAHCSAHEVGWAGVEEEGLPIIGSVWNYYFCNALLNSSANLNDDGYVSIEEAFNFSTPLQQRYMNETVFAVPEFLEMFHDIGIYPENYDAYPHPVMDDQYPEQLNLDLRPHWTTSFIESGGYPVVDFTVYNETLYVTSDNKLYMYDGGSWNMIDAPTYILSLEPYQDKLVIGGKGGLYYYDGANFTLVFTVSNYIKPLGVYNNTLYAGTVLDKSPTLYYCNGSVVNPANWHVDTDYATILNFPGPFGSIDSFAAYNDNLYVASGDTVYSYDGADWTIAKTFDDVNAFLDMEVYNNRLYLATRDQGWRKPIYQGYSGFSGRAIEFDGNNWTTVFDHDYWIYSLETYDNKLYVGTANKIYIFDGTDWEISFNATEDAFYAISMVTFNNSIYVGMGNGYIFADPSTDVLNETIVIPEFPSLIVLPLFMTITLLTAIIYSKHRRKKDYRN